MKNLKTNTHRLLLVFSFILVSGLALVGCGQDIVIEEGMTYNDYFEKYESDFLNEQEELIAEAIENIESIEDEYISQLPNLEDYYDLSELESINEFIAHLNDIEQGIVDSPSIEESFILSFELVIDVFGELFERGELLAFVGATERFIEDLAQTDIEDYNSRVVERAKQLVNDVKKTKPNTKLGKAMYSEHIEPIYTDIQDMLTMISEFLENEDPLLDEIFTFLDELINAIEVIDEKVVAVEALFDSEIE